MKLLLLYCIIVLNTNLFAQQTATKQETVNWLKSRLDYSYMHDEQYAGLRMKYDFTKNILYYKFHFKDNNGKARDGFVEYVIPLNNINPDRLIAEKVWLMDGVYIKLFTNNETESIDNRHIDIVNGVEKDANFAYKTSNCSIILPSHLLSQDKDLPERVIKALRHLIILSGGKGEKF